jgi:predicted ATP-dependent endonuclease of OLD family
MSSIDKLAVRGIRSFSPFDEEKIEFYKPLTLILGQNGAGKTVRIVLTCIMIVLDYHRKFAYNDFWVYASSHSRWEDFYS